MTFKESTVIKQLLKPKNVSKSNNENEGAIHKVLFISIVSIFISLSLPQFASDRLGIGIMIIFTSLIYALIVLKYKNIELNFNLIDLSIFLFALSTIISTFSSYFFKESLIGSFKYLLFISFYFIIRFGISKNQMQNLWKLLIVLGGAVSIYGIYQYFIGVAPLATWNDTSLEGDQTRVYSTLGNPNLLAGYLLIILPLNIIAPLTILKNNILKIIFMLIALSIFTCIFFTGSRGAYIGLIAECGFGGLAGLVYILKEKPIWLKNKTVILFSTIVFFLILTVGFYLLPSFIERLETIFLSRDHSSNNFRMNVWIASLNMLKDNFLLGIGPGNTTFRLAYGLYMFSGYESLSSYNVFLELAIQCGVLGIISFLLILFTSFIKLHFIFWNEKNLLALAIVLSLIGCIFHGMVDTVLFRPQIFIPFWFLLANIGKLKAN